MKVIAMFLALSVSSIAEYREVYQLQHEDKILAALKILDAKSVLTADERCYKAVFTCMKADYLTWPYEKLKAFKKGYKELNSIIANSPNNVEYRYHRYMIEKHTPSLLIDVNHMQADKSYVKANLKSNHPMYSFISKTIDK
jgi:hypothetical protein